MILRGKSVLLADHGFYAAESDAHFIVQDEFGELFVITPMAIRPNFSPAPDSSRPIFSAVGVFEWLEKDISLHLEKIQISSRTPCVTFHRCDLGSIRRGDVLTRCAGSETFEVKEAMRDGLSGMKVELIQLGIQN